MKGWSDRFQGDRPGGVQGWECTLGALGLTAPPREDPSCWVTPHKQPHSPPVTSPAPGAQGRGQPHLPAASGSPPGPLAVLLSNPGSGHCCHLGPCPLMILSHLGKVALKGSHQAHVIT